jgi:hypothetical protein
MLSIPFAGVRIGSVLMADGTIAKDRDVFRLLYLGNCIKQSAGNGVFKDVSGSSTYSSRASSRYGALSTAGQYGVPFVSSVKVALETSYSQSSASDGQQISLNSIVVGTNKICIIEWDKLSPEDFIACLNSSMQADNSMLFNVLACARQVVDLLRQPGVDLGQPTAELTAKAQEYFDAKAKFQQNYGVGFVSGVLIGGAASVTGQFDKSSASAQSQFDIKANVNCSGLSSSMSVGMGYGETTKESYRASTFNVTSSSYGGSQYAAYAQEYENTFKNKSFDLLWDTSIQSSLTSPPPIPKLDLQPPKLIEPENIKPKNPEASKQAAEDYDAIKNTNDLQKMSAISTAASSSGKSISAADQVALNNQAIQQLTQTTAKVNEVSSADFNAGRASAPLPDQSQAPLLRSSGGLKAVAPSSDVADNNAYWEAMRQGNEVVGVRITRWEDVLPGFSLDSPFENQLQINQLTRLLSFITAANEAANISRMFSMAAVFNVASESDWNGMAYIFSKFSSDLRLAAGLNAPGSLDEFISAWGDQERKIFNTYRDYAWLFEANRVGFGGYMEFAKDNAFSGDDIYYRVGEGDRQSTATANGKYVWFTPKLLPLGVNPPPANQVSVPTVYCGSIKFYPVLALDCSGFYLMVAEPKWGLYGFYMNGGFFGNESPYLKLFPLSCVKKTPYNRKNEAVLTFQENVELWKYDVVSNLYTIGYKHRDAPATDELLPRGRRRKPEWVFHNGRNPVRLHLVPFEAADLNGVKDWMGFILSTPNLAPEVSSQMQQLQKAMIDNRGVNYWMKTAKASGEILSFTDNYQPYWLDQLSLYWGSDETMKYFGG